MKNPEQHIGKFYQAADGGNYGIFIVGYLPEVDDFVVMSTTGGKIDYSIESHPYRIDPWKASYRYIMEDSTNESR